MVGYRGPVSPSTGNRPLVFRRPKSIGRDDEVKVPCGQCVGCRLDRSRVWAVRCLHEASLYEDNCFVTLTYGPKTLPSDGSLVLDHWQCFAKRLRKAGVAFRYFMCGEYGERLSRPHYHACFFGWRPDDLKLYRSTARGDRLYTSEFLEKTWGLGFCIVGDVTFESAAYVARYVLKKQTGEGVQEYYEGRKPEFTTMSRRPGLGSGWLEKYRSDVYPSGLVVERGVKMAPPRFYDEIYKKFDPKGFETLKLKRKYVSRDWYETSYQRLYVKDKVKALKIRALTRAYELEDL